MITRTTAFSTEAGVFHTLEEAQRAAVAKLLNIDPGAVPNAIVTYKDELVDILTTKATSRPKARKSNGGKKTRKAKTEVGTPELLTEAAK